MRSLSLARALEQRGADCVFLAPPEAGAILDVFAPGMGRQDTDVIDANSVLGAAMGVRFDAVVFDHYGLGRAEQEAVAQGRPTLVIDDLADRPLFADLVLDPGPARTPADYAPFAPSARLLLGPAYAPVRPEFAALREQALARRGGPVGRVLVALGLTDVGGITARALDRLRQRSGQLAFDVALGGASPSLPGLKRIAAHDRRVTLHIDAQDMADLALNADVAVGAGGGATWERCVLGLPSLMVVLAPNQRPAAQALLDRDAVLVVDGQAADFDAAFDRAAMRLLTDAATRARLTAASLEICDGLGADRAAQAFLEVIGAPGETA